MLLIEGVLIRVESNNLRLLVRGVHRGSYELCSSGCSGGESLLLAGVMEQPCVGHHPGAYCLP